MAASHTSATHATATGLIPTGGVSLTLPEALSFAEWADVGRELARSRNRIQWLVGDWWRFGAHRYGQRRLAVEQWGGPSFLTSENYGWVAGAFAETSRRREVLTFSHHAEVAALDPADADALLDWCLDMPAGSRRSVHELRIEVRRRQAPPPQQITVEIS